MKVGVLFSGGKDSTYAGYLAKKDGHEVVCLLTVHSENEESYMFHTPSISKTKQQAEVMGLPLMVENTKGKKEDELKDLEKIIIRAVQEDKKSEIQMILSASQMQVHDLLFSRELGWQEIIYDLINTEQLDPWNIDITVLAERYLEKIQDIETDFFVSSKVLLAASLLLRIKSEILLSKYMKSIDEILFGKKEDKKYVMERITLEDEIPDLVPRSPIPRVKKVTLQELMEALNKAIKTENRRIKKVIINRNALRLTSFSMPKKTISIKDRIRRIHERVISHFEVNPSHRKIPFSEFAGETKEEKIDHFYPLLELENRQKLWLHQEGHFEEIDIWLKKVYLKHNGDPYVDLRDNLKEDGEILSAEELERLDEIKEIANGEVD